MESRFKLWEDKNKGKGARRWRVRVPADVSESGKVERRFFATKLEAQGWKVGETTKYDTERALYSEDLIAWLEASGQHHDPIESLGQHGLQLAGMPGPDAQANDGQCPASWRPPPQRRTWNTWRC